MPKEWMQYLTQPVPSLRADQPKTSTDSHKAPEHLTPELINELLCAAPLNSAEAAALLCGLQPFEVEDGDNLTYTVGIQRVQVRIEDDIHRGVLASKITVKELVNWADKCGVPGDGLPILRAAINKSNAPVASKPIEKKDLKKVNSNRQQRLHAAALRFQKEKSRLPSKKEAAALMLNSPDLCEPGLSLETLMRTTRKSW